MNVPRRVALLVWCTTHVAPRQRCFLHTPRHTPPSGGSLTAGMLHYARWFRLILLKEY